MVAEVDLLGVLLEQGAHTTGSTAKLPRHPRVHAPPEAVIPGKKNCLIMNLKHASYRHRAPRTALLALLCWTLIGCAQPYSVTFNNNVLYGPDAAARRDAITRDPGLQACLDQTLERLEETDATRITLLACPGAGIETLAGIERLARLEQLELGDNDISNVSPLTKLKNLRVLGLRNNEIGDIRPLAELPLLRFLSMEGNDRVPCRQLDAFAEKLGNTFGRPQRCVN